MQRCIPAACRNLGSFSPERGRRRNGYCMNQPWLTTRDWPVSALVGNAAKSSAMRATSSVVNSPSTVSLSITLRITSASLIPAGTHVDRADAQAHLAAVDAIEVHQSLQGGAQRQRVVVAHDRRSAAQHRGQVRARSKEPRDADERGRSGTPLVQQRPVAPPGQRHVLRRRGRQPVPELPQARDALPGRIASDQGGVDGADGDAGHPVQIAVAFHQDCVDAGLAGAQGTSALEHQCLGGLVAAAAGKALSDPGSVAR
jgi:hypothetical protein